MAQELFPMYCGLSGIQGMDKEKAVSAAIMRLAQPDKTCITLIYMNGTKEWVYGYCSFKLESDHVANFKFSNTFGALQQQGVLPALVHTYGVDVILTDDAGLAQRIRASPECQPFADHVALVSRDGSGYRRGKKAAQITQFQSSGQDFQDIIIRRVEPYSSENWSVVLPTRDYTGARLLHTTSSKQKALEWALNHPTELGGHSNK